MMAGGWIDCAGDGPDCLSEVQLRLGRKLARTLKKNPDRLQPTLIDTGGA